MKDIRRQAIRLTAMGLALAAVGSRAAPCAAGAGDLDPTFGSAGIVVTEISYGFDQPSALAIQPDGKLLAAGDGHPALRLKMLAICAGTGPRLDLILEALLGDLAQGDGRALAHRDQAFARRHDRNRPATYMPRVCLPRRPVGRTLERFLVTLLSAFPRERDLEPTLVPLLEGLTQEEICGRLAVAVARSFAGDGATRTPAELRVEHFLVNGGAAPAPRVP